jgi:hypothetical protein
MTGEREMNGSALLEYFQPLYEFLKEENSIDETTTTEEPSTTTEEPSTTTKEPSTATTAAVMTFIQYPFLLVLMFRLLM